MKLKLRDLNFLRPMDVTEHRVEWERSAPLEGGSY